MTADALQAWNHRLPTGVPGLDVLLSGGLMPGSMVVVVGGPGTGKTVLAEQTAFFWTSLGRRVLWVVTLGESNEKFLAHLGGMAFADMSMVGDRLQLVNLNRQQRQGVDEQLAAIRATVRLHDFDLVVIDGLQSLRCFLRDPADVRIFLAELSGELALRGITLMITDDASPERYWEGAVFTMADAIISLERTTLEGQEQRLLNVLKLRGCPAIGGAHTCRIDSHGLHVQPRAEAVLPREGTAGGEARQPWGLPALDDLLGGGLLVGGATTLLGAAGTGKSVLADQFLAEGVRREQPCLLVSTYLDVERYLQRADHFQLPLRQAYEAGLLQVYGYEPGQSDPDGVAELVERAVETQGIRRLVFDGSDVLLQDLSVRCRVAPYLLALVRYLRARQVTTLLTHGMPDLFGTDTRLPHLALSQLSDNLLFLRLAEFAGRLRRFLTVCKSRYAAHSDTTAELLMNEGRVTLVTEMAAWREFEESRIPGA